MDTDYKQPIVNPIELDGDAIYVPVAPEEQVERDILERRLARGRVRWYERSLGYGFVREDGRTDEIFVHHSSLQFPGAKKLRAGQRVVFEICKTSRGKTIALNVIPIMEKPEALARYRLKNLMPDES